MTKRNFLTIAICFLYLGSAYMSQFYRLMDYCDGDRVDLITSFGNYMFQAAGIVLFMSLFKFKAEIAGSRIFFAVVLAFGTVFMALSQLSDSAVVIIWSGYVFNVHTGVVFGYYLTQFACFMHAGLASVMYGTAYAAGSIGTYVMSLIGDGDFLKSGIITVIYALLAAAAAVITLTGSPISRSEPAGNRKAVTGPLIQLSVIVIIMTVISVIGSGLYFSLPQAEDVNWNLIRTFYSAGLIITGIVMDKDRRIGEILTTVSLIYPLIATALIGEGVTGTVTMGLGYFFRGCLTIYYVIMFADIGKRTGRYFIAPLGLCLSRVTESLITLILMSFKFTNLVQIVTTALFFVPLIILVIIRQTLSHQTVPDAQTQVPAAVIDVKQRLALFSHKYNLTAREAEILELMHDNMTDDEISARIGISRNTVRFHVSNILKKTNSASRVEASRAVDLYIPGGMNPFQ